VRLVFSFFLAKRRRGVVREGADDSKFPRKGGKGGKGSFVERESSLTSSLNVFPWRGRRFGERKVVGFFLLSFRGARHGRERRGENRREAFAWSLNTYP